MANGAILGQSTTTWTNNQILSSVSAALYSLGANATPDQVFAAIRPLITTAQNSANNAQSAANTAQQAANSASAAASTAQNTANNALSVANGNAKIVTGSYVGTGTFGSENKTTISINGTPKLVIVAAERAYTTNCLIMLRGLYYAISVNGQGGDITVEFSTNSVSWYSDNLAQDQLNYNGVKYIYCIIF